MTRRLPLILSGLFLLWIVAGFRAPPGTTEFQTAEFGKLPVLLNGRVQPFDSVGRNSLLILRSKQTASMEGKERLNASEWLLEVFMDPEKADERKVFRIDHPELLGMLRLPENEKHFSFSELKPHWEEIQKQADRIEGIEAQVRTPFEKQVFKLNHALGLFFRLKNSLRPEGADDFAEELELFKKAIPRGLEAVRKSEAKEEYNEADLQALVHFFKRFEALSRLGYPLAVPPLDPQKSRDAWTSVGTSLMESLRSGEVHPGVVFFAQMSSAYRKQQPAEFNRALSEYRQWLSSKNLIPEIEKGRREFFYNQYQPFYKSIVIYVVALILGCLSWFNRSQWLNRSAFALILVAFALHTSGLVFRMVLEGRPPVTNLYSSAIFVGWASVLLGLLLERMFRDGLGSVTAATVGFSTLIIAHNLALGGDTMEMLRAVLDTNFWLATHVVVITLGYASVFVSGFLAILYVIRGVFTTSLTPAVAKGLTRMVYGIVCFSTLFSFVGTILGGIWADQSWGRFWGWDPKENGALLIVIWCAVVLHARWGGLIRERGLMAMAIFGNVVTSFSWFGVNMLGVGLHSYGFMDQAFKWLMGFAVSQLVLIGLAFLPQQYWMSFRNSREVATAFPDRSAPTAARS